MGRKITFIIASTSIAGGALVLPAGSASAHHDHQLHSPAGCTTINVSHQAHTTADPGRKFHGAAHTGAAVEYDSTTGVGILGQGNSPVWVKGGACPA